MSTTVKLHFSGNEPSEYERETLNSEYRAYSDARNGGSGDDEFQTAAELIETLMSYAGISCLDVEECDECENEATEFWPKLNPPLQLCEPCEHDARRSGWEPGR